MLTFDEYKKIKDEQKKIVDDISNLLNAYPRNGMGLVSNETRISPEYRKLSQSFNVEFKKEQGINRFGVKLFKNELKTERALLNRSK